MTEQVSQLTKRITIINFFIGGTILQYSMKLQSTQLVTEGEHEEKKFFHPYIQIICVFIGQLIVLLYYFLMKKNKEKEKRAYPIIVFSIPASASVITSLLQMTAINFVAPSTFSIFKGATIFGTLLFSKILVKMKITKRHILSCVIAFTGLIIIALSDFVFTGIVKKEKQFIGYILLSASLFTNGFLDTYEQKIFMKYNVTSMELVGYEGLFGFALSLILISIVSFIPCPFGVSGCVYNDQNEAFLEQPLMFFRQLSENWVLILLNITYIIGIIMFCFFGANITKFYSALTRGIAGIGKVIVNWTIGIIITVSVTNQAYKIQSTDWRVILLKLTGFAFVVVGILIYLQVIKLKFLQEKQKKKELLQANSQEEKFQ